MKNLLTFGRDYLVNEPSSALLCGVLVTVNLLLLESPFWQLFRMGPHGHPGGTMNKPEVARFALPWILRVGVDNVQVEQGIIVSCVIILGPCSEFLVCWHKRGSDVVRE